MVLVSPPVSCFLSCSVRSRDRDLVRALASQVLTPMGFACRTIGRNVSLPAQVDDAVKQLLLQSDCLIGVATVRYDAADVDSPDRTLRLATPYLVQETAAAHQLGLPFLIFRTEGVMLEGVARRNLYIDIRDNLSSQGKIRFACGQELVTSSLVQLYKRAITYSERRKKESFWNSAKNLGLLAAGTVVAVKTLGILGRPACFGEFYYLNPECKACSSKGNCKVEKQRLRG